jgi:hypothetical protein
VEIFGVVPRACLCAQQKRNLREKNLDEFFLLARTLKKGVLCGLFFFAWMRTSSSLFAHVY